MSEGSKEKKSVSNQTFKLPFSLLSLLFLFYFRIQSFGIILRFFFCFCSYGTADVYCGIFVFCSSKFVWIVAIARFLKVFREFTGARIANLVDYSLNLPQIKATNQKFPFKRFLCLLTVSLFSSGTFFPLSSPLV